MKFPSRTDPRLYLSGHDPYDPEATMEKIMARHFTYEIFYAKLHGMNSAHASTVVCRFSHKGSEAAVKDPHVACRQQLSDGKRVLP